MVRLPDPVTRMPSMRFSGNRLVELLQQVVGGLDGAARDAPVLGEHQRPLAGLSTPAGGTPGLVGAERFEQRPVLRLAQGGQFQTDRADVQTDIDAHLAWWHSL